MSVEHHSSQPGTGGPPSAAGLVPAQAQPSPPSGDGPGPPGRKARILIVDDEAWDAELAQRLLTGAGLVFTAVVVATRDPYLEQLAAFRPDVILSDYHLPGFSGEVALRIAQEQRPDVPFIIWSGVLGDDAAVELIKQGATDYVLKDRPTRLPSVIYRALAEAEQRAHLARLEALLSRAQQLASLGHLSAAADAMRLTREMLDAALQQAAAAES